MKLKQQFWRVLDLGGKSPVCTSPEAAWAAWEQLHREEQGSKFNFQAQSIIRDAVLICGTNPDRLAEVLRYETPDGSWRYADADQSKVRA